MGEKLCNIINEKIWRVCFLKGEVRDKRQELKKCFKQLNKIN
jgi:hypothetical protein